MSTRYKLLSLIKICNETATARRYLNNLIVCTLVLVLTGCASGYSRYYQTASGATPEAIAKSRATIPPETPAVEYAPNIPNVVDRYINRGYGVIGYSAFVSGKKESDAGAIAQGKKLGADLVVIIEPKYVGSVTTQMPITTPTSSTSFSSDSANIYGSGGSASVYGTSTTTTYGSQTTYVPITTNRIEYGAAYFVKRSYIFGANWRDLENDERSRVESNSGVYITNVIDGTPAFNSNLLVGDIILKANGIIIPNSEFLFNLLENKGGQPVDFYVFRNGHFFEKSVRLNQ